MRAAVLVVLACAAGLGVVVACSSSSSDNGTPPLDGGGDATPPPPPPTPADGGDGGGSSGMLPTGGSRIAARFYEGSDGSRFFADLFDKKLGIACNLRGADDGSLRCVPRTLTMVSDRYSDDKCMNLVAERNDLCETAPYAVQASNGCESIQTTVYEIGTTPVTTTFYKDATNTCVAASPPGPNTAYFSPTRKLAPSELVGFTPHDEPLSAAFAVHVLVGDDGSRLLASGTQLVDLARKDLCGPQLAGDGMPRCLPRADWAVGGFSDMGCSMPVAFGRACTIEAGIPELANDVAPGTQCDAFFPRKLHALGAPRPTHDWYFGDPASCKGPVQLPDDLVDVGAELPAAGFPALAFERLGGSRLVADTFHAGDLVLDRGPVHDKTTTAACSFITTSDGATRCVPMEPTAGVFYSDMSCTTPVAIGDEACAPATTAAISDGTCNGKWKVYALGARSDLATTMLWAKAPPGSPIPCQPQMPGGPKYVWALGAEVAPTTFVDAKLVEH